MGNTGWRTDEQKEVVLCLHSVHNVQHAPNESYYGMATDHTSEVEIPVTSERPARLTAGIDTVLSVRVFLHNRGSPSTMDRPVGQLSIPVRELLDMCGPGLYQTWFLLDAPTPYGGMQRSHTVERFRRALHGVSMELHTSRICLTLLESGTDPADWPREERDRITYYEPMLISHQQHVQVTQAYFDFIERSETASAVRAASNRSGGGSMQAPVEAAALNSELLRLQQQQREEEVGLLQRELDQITEEANKRIERGNGVIVKLKADLKQLRDEEAPQLQREQAKAEQRLDALRQEGEELRRRAEDIQDDAAAEEELQRAYQEVLVLTNQKDALMRMVQDFYGTAQTAHGGGEPDAQGPQPGAHRPEENLLPDAHELLNGGARGA
mmetsp:Transcript_119458/g.372158  ORF Transcript_119458/g.372158 Transcript_119458/m.372158 type:complete len:383 (+) Transcript_119458:105-1253(+)